MANEVKINLEESMPCNATPGSVDVQNDGSCSRQGTVRVSHYHRRLAICSIVCGNSCLGIKALINSVKAEHTENSVEAEKFSQLAKKYSIISIVAWIVIVGVSLALLALVSFLMTLID